MLCISVSFSLGVLSVVELRRSSALLLLSCSFHLSILLVFAFCILKSWLFSTCVRCLYLCHYLLCVWIDPFIIVKIFFFLSLVTPPLLISSSMWLTQHELNGFFVDFFLPHIVLFRHLLSFACIFYGFRFCGFFVLRVCFLCFSLLKNLLLLLFLTIFKEKQKEGAWRWVGGRIWEGLEVGNHGQNILYEKIFQ